MPRQRMRFKVPDDLWNLLSKLADHAKMDWFYTDNIRKATISREDAEAIECAFIVENLWKFTDDECFRMYDFFTEVSGGHDPFLSVELAKRIRQYDEEGCEHVEKSES